MAGMAVDGLVSGFATSDMISQLMRLEAAPQTLLKGKVTKAESFVSALQSLNARLSSLAQSARTASTPASWGAVTASTTAATVKASATAGAGTASLTFAVDRLAAAQSSLSGGVRSLEGFFGGTVPESLTLVTGSGDTAVATAISLKGVTDLAGLAGAIGSASAGVGATLVNVGGGVSRLQLTGSATGAGAGFDLYAGAVDPAAATKPAPLMGRAAGADGAVPGNTVLAAAVDAQVTLWGTQPVTSSSNTFSDVAPGLSFTLTTLEEKPVTVTVGRDDAALKKLGSDLVANAATVLSEIASRTKSATTTGSDGQSVVTGGALSADSATRAVQQSVLTAMSAPVDGASPASVGIVLGKDGTVSFDDKAFSAALAADPAKVRAMVTAVAARVEKVATELSDPVSGTITLKVQGQQSYVRNLSEQVENWDSRLSLRRTTLERTYAAMEVSLSKLNAQASWLSSQIDQMNAAK